MRRRVKAFATHPGNPVGLADDIAAFFIPGRADRDRVLGEEQDALIAEQNRALAEQIDRRSLEEALGEFANPKNESVWSRTTRKAYETLQLQAGRFFELNPQLEAFVLIAFMSAATAAPDVMAHHQVINGVIEGVKSAAVDLSVEPLEPEVRRE